MRRWLRIRLAGIIAMSTFIAQAQQVHDHGVPEKLGKVSFSTSCSTNVQAQFNRGVALLHSFSYTPAADAFQSVAKVDPQCAIAHWGVAMTYFHQLWEPPISPAVIATAQREILLARQIGTKTYRERGFIEAAAWLFQDAATVPYRTRALKYERAMSELAAQNKNDPETQVFYALALLATASTADKTHTNQKKAAALLEPLDLAYPDHPGIPHYLIHAYDDAELAPRGLEAAKVYSHIAPSAPHALHMPSHIFTRLGLWDDSIASNLAARDAAHTQGDIGEELHAMDYLVYAYLQHGRDQDAAKVIEQLKAMPKLNVSDFKIGYASTAMPVRYLIDGRHWADAAQLLPPVGAAPHVEAVAVWARGVGLARTGKSLEARSEASRLQQLELEVRATGNDYWAMQVAILRGEVMAWAAHADRKFDVATSLMRSAADQEDAVEKLPVTPGPIVPAREQLGDLLLEQRKPADAQKEFEAALVDAPGRRGALLGVSRSQEILKK